MPARAGRAAARRARPPGRHRWCLDAEDADWWRVRGAPGGKRGGLAEPLDGGRVALAGRGARHLISPGLRWDEGEHRLDGSNAEAGRRSDRSDVAFGQVATTSVRSGLAGVVRQPDGAGQHSGRDVEAGSIGVEPGDEVLALVRGQGERQPRRHAAPSRRSGLAPAESSPAASAAWRCSLAASAAWSMRTVSSSSVVSASVPVLTAR